MSKIWNFTKRFLKTPLQTTVEKVAQLQPKWAHRLASSRAKNFKLSKLHFFLSFDCDTLKDIEVIPEVHQRLLKVGIKAIYAVPGELLEKGADVYRELSNSGVEFLNHGYLEHAVLIPPRNYVSTVFYDQLSDEDVCNDIRRGHAAHLKVLGKAPKGFRVPHFSTYQSKHQRLLVYGVLKELGYQYSSSGMPLQGMLRGPLFSAYNGIWEIPVSGYFFRPADVIDSWGIRFAPGSKQRDGLYKSQWLAYREFYSTRPGILNTYADPSQVVDWPEFFEAMALMAPYSEGSYSNFCLNLKASSAGH